MLNVLYEVNPLQSQENVCKCKFRSLGTKESSLAWISSCSLILSKVFRVYASSTAGATGESTRLHAEALNTTSHGRAREVPPSKEKDGGEKGRGWSSWEALEIYQGKRPEAIGGLLVYVHQLGALLLHPPGIQRSHALS